MTSKRAISKVSLSFAIQPAQRASNRISTRSISSLYHHPIRRQARNPLPRISNPSQLRRNTTSSSPSSSTPRLYTFTDIQSLSQSPSPSRILIDVREPSEFEPGHIPSAINIPITSQPDALLLPPEEFEDKFGFEKPDTGKEIVFYCKAGVRSSAAAKLALQGGYERVGEYRGSWMDWVGNGGKEER
ncbi:MAG: hypothetical protein M1820_004588 [Bogoriella megaspora]|nr:MAG: hypothetical protein M1820_004588 [Bogoriella megaspora]